MSEYTSSPNRTLRIVCIVSCLLVLVLGFASFFSAMWYVRVYGRLGFDSVLYTLTGGLGGVNPDLIQNYLLHGVLPALLFSAVAGFLLFFPRKPLITWSTKKRTFLLYPFRLAISSALALALSLGLIIHAAFNVELVDYVIAMNTQSELYQEEYRDPNQVNITFPEQKRNLVYIMLESMETSYLSTEQGGAMPYNLIPELYRLAQENVNFSHNEDVGGFPQVNGASWTVGAMVAQTAGVPLKVPDGIKDWQNGYGKDGVFLPGLTSLTNILQEAGYYQTLMVGSDASFGGRRTYFNTHGMDHIYDIYTARKDGIVASNYWDNWWGYEDYYLFEYAKQELTQIAAGDQPFAFTLLTVDTHHIGGHACPYCQDTYDENYENVISCSSRQVYAFVRWLQEQPFYENTTVVVTGDHCSMDNGFFERNVAPNYQRHVYNCFINSAATATFTQNRKFCAMDMFPTTLAAMGCTIEGERLGLGTNLFSKAPTLMETMGVGSFTAELSKASEYYASHFYTEQTP